MLSSQMMSLRPLRSPLQGRRASDCVIKSPSARILPCIRLGRLGQHSAQGSSKDDQVLVPVPAEPAQGEHVAMKAIKMALLVPVVLSVVWTGPAHAARKSRQAAAAQVVQETAPTAASPLEQLQATMQGLWQQVTHTGSKAAEDAAQQAQVLSGEASTLQQKLAAELEKPEVRKGVTAAVVIFLLALAYGASSSGKSKDTSSDATTTSSSSNTPAVETEASAGSSGGGSNAGTKAPAATVPATSNGRSAAAAAGLAAAAVTAKASPEATPAAAAPAAPPAKAPAPKAAAEPPSAAAASAKPASSPAAAAAAPARPQSPQELLAAVKESANRVNAAAAATANELSATAAAATAAAKQAEAVAVKAQAALASNGSNGVASRAPSPPKIVKPELPSSNASKPSATAPKAAASSGPARASSPASSSSRSGSPSVLKAIPNKGAATPALAVLGAGAVILDLMSPFASLAVSSLTGGSRPSSRNGDNGSVSSNGLAASAVEPEHEPVPQRPSTPSRLEQAAAAAAAANAASLPRAAPIELPVVTLEQLEQAVGASTKQ